MVLAENLGAATESGAALTVFFQHTPSPLGSLCIAASDAGLHAIELLKNRHPIQRNPRWQEGTHPLLRAAAVQLAEYFHGQRRTFELPLAPQGTALQQRVWQALRQIPYGHTWSHAQLAEAIGQPGAARAVGAANGRNPLPIVIPSHRVIGADGLPTGAGGSQRVKVFLLQLEGADLPSLWRPRRPRATCYSYFSIGSAREQAQLAATPGGDRFSPKGIVATLKHIRATYGPTNFDPAAITAALGIQPHRAWVQGQPSRHLDGRPYCVSGWSGCRKTRPALNAGQQCLQIVRQLQDKIDTLNALREQYDLFYCLEVVPTMNAADSTPALYFDQEVIDFCHRTGTEIDVDMYVED